MINSPKADLGNARTVWLVFQNLRQSGIYRDYLEMDGYRVKTEQDVLDISQKGPQACPDVIVLDGDDQLAKLEEYLQAGDGAGRVLIFMDPEASDQRLSPGANNGVFHLTLKQKVRPRELSGQIRAALHRVGKSAPSACTYRAGGILLDREMHAVTAAEQYVYLTPTEFDLLSVLMAAPDQVFSRQDLLERIGGDSQEGSLRTIDVHIRNIRAKLKAGGPQHVVIKTIYRVGYRLSPGK